MAQKGEQQNDEANDTVLTVADEAVQIEAPIEGQKRLSFCVLLKKGFRSTWCGRFLGHVGAVALA